MSAAAVIGLVVALVVIGLGARLVWIGTRTFDWQDLRPGVKYAAHDGQPVDAELLGEAWDSTVRIIVGASPWTEFAVRGALVNVRVIVMPTPTWVDQWFRRVAGLQQDGCLWIGSDFKALTHECIHRCEEYIHGHADGTHKTWRDRGLRVVEALGEARLAGLKRQHGYE